MAIPNNAAQQRSYIAGMIASESPTRVDTAVLKYTIAGENFATPSRACTLNLDGETVAPGGTGFFAGIIVGNMRVLSDRGESWHQNGDVIELMQMGEIAVNFDNESSTFTAPAVGGEVWFEKSTGKLRTAQNNTDNTKIVGAVITKVGVTADPQLAVISLTGPAI